MHEDIAVVGDDDELWGDEDDELDFDLDDEDVSGQEEILGEVLADDDVLGAVLRGRSGRAKRALKKFFNKRKMRRATVVARKKPTSAGVEPIGFVSANPLLVPVGGTQNIITQPQTLFKPHRLIIGQTIAPLFTIDDIRIANRSVFPSANPLPAETFIPNAESAVLDLPTVQPAINFLIQVTNVSGAPSPFRATVIGRDVRYG